MKLRCKLCNWQGDRTELIQKGSVTLADSWWGCPTPGCEGDWSELEEIYESTQRGGSTRSTPNEQVLDHRQQKGIY
jgi:hypothetical protein